MTSGSEAQGRAERLADGRFALLGADGEAVRGDELGLDADEVEHAAQIGLEMLERRGRRTFIIEAAACEGDVCVGCAPGTTTGCSNGSGPIGCGPS